jgi:hypothetical protein
MGNLGCEIACSTLIIDFTCLIWITTTIFSSLKSPVAFIRIYNLIFILTESSSSYVCEAAIECRSILVALSRLKQI